MATTTKRTETSRGPSALAMMAIGTALQIVGARGGS
jgi:hypothetical protein